MSRFMTLGALALAAVIAVGCSDTPNPLSPESAPTPSFSAAAVTPFTATLTLNNQSNPGVVTFSAGGKIIHIRGQTLDGPLTGDLGVGTGEVVTDFDGDLATFHGPGRGTFTLFLAGGTYEGRFAGIIDGPVFSNHFEGEGTGAFAGMKIQGTATDEADPFNDVFILTGRHVDPSP